LLGLAECLHVVALDKKIKEKQKKREAIFPTGFINYWLVPVGTFPQAGVVVS